MTAHQVTAACRDVHCAYHEDDEDPAGAVRVCFECGHAYLTAGEIRQAWADGAPPELRGMPAPPAEEIGFCPLCMHDW
jgi:hypothetical protein